ncbi:MAG: alcohol dehydrogenase [Novosphingobium sp.]|nr:alcohol dehydrogenase [Novosphingobium sp.]
MRASPHDLTGRVAIVTGGARGIGKAIALLLAEAGADIVIAGRRQEPLDDTAAEIAKATGRRCVSVSTDVREARQAGAMVERTIAEFGRLDILINNAGRGSHAPLRNMTTEIWDNDVSLNLNAAFYCSQAAYPYLSAHGNGAIVNISSLAGVHGTMGVGAYSAAKAGLQQFTRVAAAEFGSKGVRVNCVAPGMIATDAAQLGWAKTGFDAMAACQSFPLRRPGRPEEVAQAVLFLASDAASYITGETLTVGGGPQLKGMIDTEA